MSDLAHRISSSPDICGGRPCIAGTRIRVSDVLDLLAGGETRTEILAEYPQLSDEDISAALAYGSAAASHRVIRAAE
jgi:uncharacterized protein (DUF433 family)